MTGVDLLGQMDRDGYAILRGTYPAPLIQRLHEAYLELEPTFLAGGVEVGDARIMFPIVVQPPFSDPALLATNRILIFLRALLGDELVILGYGGVVARPGAPAQHVHKDHPHLYPLPLGAELPCHAVTLVVPLVDLDETTGSTALYPGTHRTFDSNGVTPYVTSFRRGDCYFMDYRLTHSGTANPGKVPRPLLYIVYSRPWFVDIRNYKEMPPLELLPAEQVQLPPAVRGLFRRAAIPLPGLR